MIDTVILWILVMTGIGTIISGYQLFKVRIVLGWPIFQGTMRSIFNEHFFLLVVWVAALITYAVTAYLWDPTEMMRQWIRFGLVSSLLIIIWAFAIRSHIWYWQWNGDKKDKDGPPRHRGGMEGED